MLFLVTLAVIPVVYSYLYYRRQLKNGTASVTPILKSSVSKAIVIGCAVFVAAILVFIGIIMFSGDIGIKYGDESFTVDASFWNGITVEYEAIDSIEYRDNIDTGIRTYGFGSPKLLAGSFCNEEFGDYTRYSYAGCSACVVLNVGDKILVISGADAESTRNIYNELTAKIKQS